MLHAGPLTYKEFHKKEFHENTPFEDILYLSFTDWTECETETFMLTQQSCIDLAITTKISINFLQGVNKILRFSKILKDISDSGLSRFTLGVGV